MPADPKRVQVVFRTAVEEPDLAVRAAVLDRECGDDVDLRRRVQALLKANDEPDSYLDRPAVAPVNGTVDYAPITEKPGTMIGPYKLKEQIGEGGFGLVFVAEQTEPVKRKVALKVIKPGMDTREVMARFTAERQALALMDHPNIARVLDAGATDSGRPYFVMELVRGIPITDYCDKNQLSPRDRLDLFVTVCHAVQHAHQKGIIHRDIKPSNVLVTSHDGKPVAKVIDFGVAKAISQQLTERSIYTNFAQMIGTPLYMSPEQAEMSGLDIDTRSDIYSLGVLLYELLTGTTPIDKKRFAKAAYDEIRRLIREDEPQKPSTRLSTSESIVSVAAQRHTEPAKLSKLMRGDLDWITMKALEKDRTRRYETANGLARDIQRYLSDEPVEACPPSTTYRLRKFAKKNRAALSTAITIALLLVAGVGVSAWQAVRATRAEQAERDRAEGERLAKLAAIENEKIAIEQKAKAERARDRTRDVLDAMTSAATGDSLTTQNEISEEQKKFLTDVLTYYQEFAGDKSDDERSRARTADAAYRVGKIESRLGRTEQEIAAFQKSLEGYRSLVTDFPTSPTYRHELSRNHNQVGRMLATLGKRVDAQEQLLKSKAIAEKLVAEFPDMPDYRLQLALVLNNMAMLQSGLGNRPNAESLFRQAQAIEKKLVADFPTKPDYRKELITNHTNLSGLLRDLGRWAEVEEEYRTALSIAEKLYAEFPAVTDYRWQLATGHANLGVLLAETGRPVEAEEQYRIGLAMREKLAADFPAVPDHQSALAGSYNNLGNLLRNQGKPTEAAEQFRKSLAIQSKLATDFSTLLTYRREHARSLNNLGHLLKDHGKPVEAEEQFRASLTIMAKLVAESPDVPEYRHEIAGSSANLGKHLRVQGKRAEAVERLRQAIDVETKLVAEIPDVPVYRQDLSFSHNELGIVLRELGKRTDAELQFLKGLAIREKLAAEFPDIAEHQVNLAGSHNNVGVLLNEFGKPEEGEDHFRKALAIKEKLAADFPTVLSYRHDLVSTYNNLGMVVSDRGQHAEAEALFRKALAISDKLLAEFPTVPDYRHDVADCLHRLAMQLNIMGKRTEAQELYRKGLIIQEKLAADFPKVVGYRQKLADFHNVLGVLFKDSGKRTEAEEQYRLSLAINEMLAADYPAVPKYQVLLGGGYCNFGNLVRDGGRAGESLGWYDKAIATLAPVHRAEPRDVEAKQYLCNSYGGRVGAYTALAKHSEAVKDWDKIIELCRPELQLGGRAERAMSQLQAGLVAEAVAEVAELTKLSNWNKDQWFNFASIYAAASGKSADKKQEYADRANELVHIAVKAAFKKSANVKEDTDLNALPAFQIALGASYCNLGIWIGDGGQISESLGWFDKAIAALTPVHRAEPSNAETKHYLRNSHANRAMANGRLARYAESVKDWDRSIELSAPTDQGRQRASRATSRVQAGMIAEAVAEVAELTKSPNWKVDQWYDFACVYGIASVKITDKKQDYADRAMELLQKAVESGYNDTAHMKKDTDLDPLRDREDFKKLIAQLEKAAEKK